MGRSEIRNKVIARVFKEMKFIEEWGTGIKRIVAVCKNAGLIEPEFAESGMYFKVILYKNKMDSEINDSKRLIDSSGLEKLIMSGISDNEKKIVQYLKNNQFITNLKAIEVTDLSSSGVRKTFTSLKSKDLIISNGEGSSRRYYLKEI